MPRQLMDRRYCEECGAQSEGLSSSDMDDSDNQVRCCSYCGYEVELLQPDSDQPFAAFTFAAESVHAPVA